MTPRTTLSACLIVRDEEARLPAALAAVAFCDEIVVVDSGSRDRTVEIARAAGAKVVEQPWLGFAAQRNVALDHATGDWVLEVDADERVSPQLAREIRAWLDAGPPPGRDMGMLPLRSMFLGRPLGPSAKYPAYRARLFRRGAFRHDERRTVHEGLWPHGPVHAFTGDLEHALAGSLREALADTWAYSRLEASQLRAGGGMGAMARGVVARPLAKAAWRAGVDGGWRDGWRGLLKIALDCAGDALVWVLHARRGAAGAGSPAHITPPPPRVGPVRLVGIAPGRGAVRALAWLVEAAAAGADVALVTDLPGLPAPDSVQVREVARLGPLGLLRALDAEEQLRPYDALVPFGARARRLVALVPPGRRGPVAPLAPEPPAATRVDAVTEATRTGA